MRSKLKTSSQKGPLKRAGLCSFKACRLQKVFLKITAGVLAVTFFSTQNLWALDPRQKLIDDQLLLGTLADGKKEGGAALQPLSTAFEQKAVNSVSSNTDLKNLIDSNNFTLQSDNAQLISYVNQSLKTSGAAKITRTVTKIADGKPAASPYAIAFPTTPPAVTNSANLNVPYSFRSADKTQVFDLKEGSNVVSVSETYGGLLFTATLTVTLDTRAPVIQVPVPPPSVTNLRTLTLKYTLDGAGKSKSFTLKEGQNALSFQEADNVGNTAVYSFKVTLDTVAPKVVLASPIPSRTNQKTLSVAYTSDGVQKTAAFDLQEGSNSLTLQEKDAAGNISKYSFSILLDTLPPVLKFTPEPPAFTNKPNLPVVYTSDGAYKTLTAALKEGANTVLFTASDAVGNTTTQTRVITLDTRAPVVRLITEPPTDTNQQTLILPYTSDGETRTKTVVLKEGANVISIIETDLAGNKTTLNRTVKLDTIAPVVVLSSSTPLVTKVTNLTVSYTTDGASRTKAFVLKEGANTLTISEKDAIGNLTVKTFTVTRDTLAPVVVITGDIPPLTNKKVFTIDYTSDGVAKQKIFDLKEGANTITFDETDLAGNRTVLTRSVKLDTVPPAIVITANPPQITLEPSVTIAYTTDGVAKSRTFDLVPGLNHLKLSETDAAGNVAQVIYDITLSLKPVLALSTPIPDTVPDRTVTVNYTVDGTGKSKTFDLDPGQNIIELSETNAYGQTTTQSFWVTSTYAPASTPDSAEFTLTTSSGDELLYADDTLQEIRTSSGDLLQNMTLNADGTIRDAQITLADGSVQLYDNGQVIGYLRPDGTRVFYKDGKIQKTLSPKGEETLYSYINSLITSESASYITVYEADGTLKSILSKSDGTARFFDHGVLTSVTISTGESLVYTQTVSATDGLLMLTSPAVPALRADQFGSALPFREAWIDPKTKLYTKLITTDGLTLTFDTRGILASSRDALGHTVTFDAATSALGNLLNAQVTQNGVTSSYDSKGNLTQVLVNGLDVHYKADRSGIDFIEQPDGTRIEGVTLDAAGAVQNAVITTSSGEIRTYEAGHLVRVVQEDETEFTFVFDAQKAQSVLHDILTSDKLRYTFSYEPNKITATLDPAILPKSDTVVQMQYDASMNLKESLKKNNEVIRYTTDHRIAQIISPSEAVKVFDYASDGTYIVTQGFNQSFYDTANNLQKVIVLPHDGMTKTLEIDYQYGKIREVYDISGAGRVLVFKYSYIQNPDNTEWVQIQDVQENAVKTYSEGILLTSLDINTSVLSSYSYQTGTDKVQKVTLTRLARVLHTYTYAYDGANTLVTDESGVLRTYDSSQKLIFMDKDKQHYGYTYVTNPDGEEIVTEKLLQKTLSDGSVVSYDPVSSDGIQKIQKPDGTVLTNIILNPDNTLKQATITLLDGTKNIFSDSALLEEITPDGTHFYYQDSRITRVTDPSGRDLTYTYDKDAAGNVTQVWIKSGDAFLKYDLTGNLLGLKLAGIPTVDQVRSATQDIYDGAGYGPYSVDGNFETAQGSSVSRSFGRTQGSVSVYVYSTHTFPEPQTITQLDYRFYTHGAGWGSYNSGSGGGAAIEYQTTAGGPWLQVSGTQHGMGDTGHATKAVTLTGVVAIRAVASGYGEGSDQGGCNAGAFIYELQYTLADQTFLAYSQSKNFQNVLTGYDLKGPLGTIRIDEQGKLLPGNLPVSFAPAAESLNNNIAFLSDKPYFFKLGASRVQSSWIQTAKEALIDPSTVLAQEYSSSGVLQTQVKADQTATLFENNLPSKVMNSKGEVLIQYFYDSEGHPSRVYLKNARDTLPTEVTKAQETIESQRAAALREIAKQKNYSGPVNLDQ